MPLPSFGAIMKVMIHLLRSAGAACYSATSGEALTWQKAQTRATRSSSTIF